MVHLQGAAPWPRVSEVVIVDSHYLITVGTLHSACTILIACVVLPANRVLQHVGPMSLPRLARLAPARPVQQTWCQQATRVDACARVAGYHRMAHLGRMATWHVRHARQVSLHSHQQQRARGRPPLSLSPSLSLLLSDSASLQLSLPLPLFLSIFSLAGSYKTVYHVIAKDAVQETSRTSPVRVALLPLLYSITVGKHTLLPGRQTRARPQACVPSATIFAGHTLFPDNAPTTNICLCDAGYAAAAGDLKCSPCRGYYQFSAAGAASCSECECTETARHVMQHNIHL
jgi:hypothetical protein